MEEIRPFQLRSFDEEVQLQAELARAREQLQAALEERDHIRDEARREGLELGRREGRDEAAKAERERVARETAGLADLLVAAAAAIDAKRAELVASAERDLVKLALAIAGKIVKVEALRGGKIVLGNLQRAIELTARRQDLKVLLNPVDAAIVDGFLPELRRKFSDIQSVTLDHDPAVARGGVIVQTREGSVDVTPATQLAEIERGLLG
jgi:flagellar assembly protein FliH